MNGYMFDTNIFNNILDGKVDPSLLDGKGCFATHVQHDEIQATIEFGGAACNMHYVLKPIHTTA